MTRPARQYELFGAVCNGQATEAQRQQLEQLLGADAEARRRYLHYITLHTQLRDRVQGSGFRVQDPVQPEPARRRSRSVWYAGLAAVIACALSAWFLLSSEPRTLPPEPSAPHHVALVTNLDAAVFAGGGAVGLGDELAAGALVLESGAAQVMFASGAVVDLVGPCELRMIDADRAMLASGSIQTYVPQQARGFTVQGPGGVRVVDLGTRFTMTVDALSQTHVLVMEGTVALSLMADGDEPRVELLTAGYQMIADPVQRKFVRVDTGDGPITIVGDAVLVSGEADGTIYRKPDGTGAGFFDMQDLIVGSATGPADYNGIALFRLPQRPVGGLRSAALRLTVAAGGRVPDANLDVWALGYIAAPASLNSRWILLADSDDRTGAALGVEPADASPVKIADNMVPADSPLEKGLDWQTDTTQSAALATYLNSLYDRGAKAGDWLVVRINPDAPVAQTHDGVAHPFASIRFGGSHRTAPDQRARLLLSAGASPAAESSALKEIKP